MTIFKGITQASFFGIVSGGLLATTTLTWLRVENSFLLPVLVAFWWLIIFGCNLFHAYKLSLKPIKNLSRLTFQFTHALVAAAVYFGVDVSIGHQNAGLVHSGDLSQTLNAGLTTNVDAIFSNTMVVVGAAFVLSILSSGLLYSILSRPAAK